MDNDEVQRSLMRQIFKTEEKKFKVETNKIMEDDIQFCDQICEDEDDLASYVGDHRHFVRFMNSYKTEEKKVQVRKAIYNRQLADGRIDPQMIDYQTKTVTVVVDSKIEDFIEYMHDLSNYCPNI